MMRALLLLAGAALLIAAFEVYRSPAMAVLLDAYALCV